jgi:CCR4-NOT transcription complex subunit 7/8
MTEEQVIREVWGHNLEQEMANIAELLDDYPYVAMDTEFPGIIAHPTGSFASQDSYRYHLMRCNVDFLKIIQIGITLGNGQGKFPTPCCTWQFNFKFNIDEDMQTTSSIDLLVQSGIDFARFLSDGISIFDFSQLLYTSGLIMNSDVYYVTYHSGYDFGYLIKMLTCKPLPADEREFFKLLDVMFPHFYDLKMMADRLGDVRDQGLQALANQLGVLRVGPQHQAGSDSLVTLKTFTALIDKAFDKQIRQPIYENRLFGFTDRTRG